MNSFDFPLVSQRLQVSVALWGKFIQQVGLTAFTSWLSLSVIFTDDWLSVTIANVMLITAVGLPTSVAMLMLYDRLGIDLFAVERCKRDGVESLGKRELPRVVRTFMSWSVPARYISVPFVSDAFMTMIMVRPGSDRYDGLTAAGWYAFIGAAILSAAVSVVFWSSVWSLLSLTGQVIWFMVHDPFMTLRH